MNIEEYRKNPCGNSSLNWHKTKNFEVPSHIKVVHHSKYRPEMGGVDYFRLIHDLEIVGEARLPSGYRFVNIDVGDEGELRTLSELIKNAYAGEELPLNQMKTMIDSPLFDESLWIGIVDEDDVMVASAISELDSTVPECSLDWFQVDDEHRGLGLGKALVNETLGRVKGRVLFATVTGKNQSAEKMYRVCGFIGNDRWHIIAESK